MYSYDLTSTYSNSKGDTRAVTDCKFFLEGRCSMASRCLFRHPSISKQFQIICKGWSRNTCFDVNCPNAHPTKLADALAGVVSIKEDVGIDHKSSASCGISKTAVLCPFFQTGYCKFGSDCKNSHNLTSVLASSSYSISSSPRTSLDNNCSRNSSNSSSGNSSSAGDSTGNSADNTLSNLGLSVLEKYSKSGLGMAHPSKRPSSDPAAPRVAAAASSSSSSTFVSSATTQAHSIAGGVDFGIEENNDINVIRSKFQIRNAYGNPEKRMKFESASSVKVSELEVEVDCRPISGKDDYNKGRSVDHGDNDNLVCSRDKGGNDNINNNDNNNSSCSASGSFGDSGNMSNDNSGLANSSRSKDSSDEPLHAHVPDTARSTSGDITFDIEIDGSFI